MKFGSDGSVRVVSEAGPNLAGRKTQFTSETPLRGALHEPVGNLPP